jgi:hypothetical protein
MYLRVLIFVSCVFGSFGLYAQKDVSITQKEKVVSNRSLRAAHREFYFYPNPFQEYIIAEGLHYDDTVELYSANGVMLKRWSIWNNVKQNLATNDLPNGSYYLRLRTIENEQLFLKFIKK